MANPYETLYQTEQLYRIPDEQWDSVTRPHAPAAEVLPAVIEVAALLGELDELLTKTTAVAPQQTETPDPTPTLVARANTPVVPEPALAVEPAAPLPAPELLPRVLTRPAVPPIVSPQPPVSKPKLNHKVLLLADEELDPSNLLFLEKILNAVHLNIDGVDLLNLNGVRNVDFAELVADKKIHHFITFGVPFGRIHLDIMMDRYQPVRFFGINFLMADSLPTIEADVNLKKRLWAALQQIFAPPVTP